MSKQRESKGNMALKTHVAEIKHLVLIIFAFWPFTSGELPVADYGSSYTVIQNSCQFCIKAPSKKIATTTQSRASVAMLSNARDKCKEGSVV